MEEKAHNLMNFDDKITNNLRKPDGSRFNTIRDPVVPSFIFLPLQTLTIFCPPSTPDSTNRHE